jgi:hypothetical protein
VSIFLRAFIRQPKTVAVLLGCIVALLTAAAAAANGVQPVTVGPVIVADATVTVNGQPASVEADGTIVANVDLTGQSTLTIAATDPATGQTTTTTIPVSLIGPGGIIPASVLDDLKNAVVTVSVPPGGFAALPGTPVQVSGSVADKGTLAGLTVNLRKAPPNPAASTSPPLPQPAPRSQPTRRTASGS